MSKNNNTKKKNIFKNLGTKILNFSKLLWAVLTYKFILLIVAVILVVNCFSDFKASVKRKIDKNTENIVESMATDSLQKIQLKINDEFSVLETLTLLYDGNDEIEMATTQSLYERELSSHPFVGIDLISNVNEPLLSLGTHVNYEDDVFIETILAGNNTVSSIVFDSTGNEYICLGVPIVKDTQLIGALIGEYDIDEFTEIIDTSSFGQVGSIFIAEEDGTLVARPESVGENTNLFELLDSINIDNEKEIEILKKNIIKGHSGVITYGDSKYKRYICYNHIPDTDWYAISIVSGNTMDKTTRKVSTSAVNFSIKVGFIFVIYILVTIAIDIRILRHNNSENNTKKSKS